MLKVDVKLVLKLLLYPSFNVPVIAVRMDVYCDYLRWMTNLSFAVVVITLHLLTSLRV